MPISAQYKGKEKMVGKALEGMDGWIDMRRENKEKEFFDDDDGDEDEDEGEADDKEDDKNKKDGDEKGKKGKKK